jgi:hypothetical protein
LPLASDQGNIRVSILMTQPKARQTRRKGAAGLLSAAVAYLWTLPAWAQQSDAAITGESSTVPTQILPMSAFGLVDTKIPLAVLIGLTLHRLCGKMAEGCRHRPMMQGRSDTNSKRIRIPLVKLLAPEPVARRAWTGVLLLIQLPHSFAGIFS